MNHLSSNFMITSNSENNLIAGKPSEQNHVLGNNKDITTIYGSRYSIMDQVKYVEGSIFTWSILEYLDPCET